MLKPNDKIGQYQLLQKLGNGAFGEVWRAVKADALVSAEYAIKFAISDDVDLDAIKREAQVWKLASGHQNIIPIIEASIYDGQLVIVSEFARDGSLQGWLKRHDGRAPSLEAAVTMTDGILAGLEHLHAQRIIHRDLKPDNVLLQGATPRLADFGLSRVLKSSNSTNHIAGTISYMSPETFNGDRSEQADLWATAVILYQLVAGRLPFKKPGQMTEAEIYSILTEPPNPLPVGVPAGLQRFFARAFEKDPKKRFASAHRMRRRLRGVLQPENHAPKPKPPKPTLRAKANPAFKRISNRTLAILGVVVFGVFWIYQANRTPSGVTPAVATVTRAPTLPDLGPEFIETKNNLSLVMKRVLNGSFMMGSHDLEAGRYPDEGPQHQVTVKDFYIGKYEITQAQWQTVMDTSPARFTGDLQRPVENISWNDAREFCQKLNALTGKTYSLPSEAEWEYAARAKTTTPYAGDLDAMGWYDKDLDKTTHPVGQKQANAFGLFDMHGNVWEWCEDVWHDRYGEHHGNPPTNGAAWLSGGDPKYRILRGGSWGSDWRHCRSADRISYTPGYRNWNNGFRVVLGSRTP